MKSDGMPVLVVEGGYPAWRTLALRALAAGLRPEQLIWTEGAPATGSVPVQLRLDGVGVVPDTCAPGVLAEELADAPAQMAAVRVSRTLSALLRDAALYRSPRRWAFLYRILWRWQQSDRAAASAADEDGARLHAMAKSVRRAKHDMIAYVRFRQRDAAGAPSYLAWYEPDHDVLAYAAEHFARRMGRESWCIGTPQGAAWWDGRTLKLTDDAPDMAAMREGMAEDATEPLWLLYYQSIFNPARLNETALRHRMPQRFWKNLPEGSLISALVVEARNGARRSGQASAVGNMPGKPVAVHAQRARSLRAPSPTLDQCRRCALWRDATQAVPGRGPQDARVMLIGEQPGDLEDLAGRVFVGPAGRVLDDALRHAGLPRDEVFVTNAVKHFKWVAHGKRRLHKTPAPQEVDACAHWLEQELASVKPAVVVTLGATALGVFLGRDARLRDHIAHPVRVGEVWLVATWHPAHAARAEVIAEITGALLQARKLAQVLTTGR